MTITSPKLDTSHLSANEEALLRCQTALELKDKGNYQGTQEVMGSLWTLGLRPDVDGLGPPVAAEVLLCAGILTRWIGSKNQIEQAQEVAKNLISESISFYEALGDVKKVAAARSELAYCYWREGALDEARIMFHEALQKLTAEGNTRANALLGLAVVEWSASRYNEALRVLTENANLFRKISNHAIKGAYHSQFAMILRKLATTENKEDYFRHAIVQYEEADYHFKLAQNIVFRADVKNNVGNILRQLSCFREAHKSIAEARRLSVSARDKIRTAQFDDTKAQVLIAEKRLKEAESVARGAVAVLEKSGQQCLLTDALITHGIALARLHKTDQAQYTFQRAIEVAHQVGALNKAGLAALTLIEELEQLPPDLLYAAYDRASQWLAESQSQDLLLRLNEAARLVFLILRGELKADDGDENLFIKPINLQEQILKFEGALIRQALAKADGSVTRAAALLCMSYQGLAYTIEARHKDLLKARSPIRRRARKVQGRD